MKNIHRGMLCSACVLPKSCTSLYTPVGKTAHAQVFRASVFQTNLIKEVICYEQEFETTLQG